MSEFGTGGYRVARGGRLWLGLLGLVVLWFFALVFRGPVIEQQLAGQINDRLASAGFQRVGVEMSGRDARLVGEVSGRAALEMARELVLGVAGVRRVRDATTQRVASLPWLRMTRSGDGEALVSGSLPDPGGWRVIDAELERAVPGRYTLSVHTDPERGDAPWVREFAGILPRIMVLERGRVEIGAGFLEADGLTADVGRHAALVSALTQIAADAGLTLVDRIALGASRPGQTPEKSAN